MQSTQTITKTIDTPRGQNIGENIKSYLLRNNLLDKVTILVVDTKRVPTERKCTTTLILSV